MYVHSTEMSSYRVSHKMSCDNDTQHGDLYLSFLFCNFPPLSFLFFSFPLQTVTFQTLYDI